MPYRSVLLALLFAEAPLLAADFNATAQPAFGGWVRPGGWTAVAVEIDGRASDWQGTVKALPSNVAYQNDAGFPSGKGRRFWLPVRYAAPAPTQPIELRPADGEPLALEYSLRGLAGEDLVVAVLSDEQRPPDLLPTAQSPFGRGTVYAVPAATQDLPPHPKAYGALSALLAVRWKPALLRPEQAEAVRTWVSEGGLLIVSGERETYTRAPWLADLLPARLVPGDAPPALEALRLHSGVPLDGRAEPPGLRLEPKPGAGVLLRAGQEAAPVAVCGRFGSGAVCSLSFDAGHPGVAAYEGWRLFALELVGQFCRRGDLRVSAPDIGLGIARALEQDVGRLSSSRHLSRIFSLFAAAYIVVLLPVNYLILRRRRRTDDLWAGMLVVIFIFSMGGGALGLMTRTRSATRSFTIVQAAPGSSRGALVSWLTHTAGERRVNDLALPPEAESAEEVGGGGGYVFDGAAFQYPAQRSGAAFERSRKGSSLKVPMEPGAVHSFRIEGGVDMGAGMTFTLESQGGLQQLRWRNGTGLQFKELFLVDAPSAAPFPRTIAAAAGGEGLLAMTQWDRRTALPPAALRDRYNDTDTRCLMTFLQAKKLECPGCWFVVGMTEGEHRAYVWPVSSSRPFWAARQNLYLQTSPYQGSWDLAGRLHLNAGQAVIAVPAAGPPPSDKGAQVRLMGAFLSNARVELLDHRTGSWAAGTPQSTEDAAADLRVALPGAAQAALLPLAFGRVAVGQVSSDGTVWAVQVDGGRASRVRVDVKADPKAAPALVGTSDGTLHLVYRQDGRLTHARGSGGRWSRATIPGTQGASAPSLAVQGSGLGLAFSVMERGVVYGSWDGRAWSVAPVFLDSGVDGPAVVAGGADVIVCYGLRGQLGCARRSGEAWSRNDGVRAGAAQGRLKALAMPSAPGYVQALALYDSPTGQSVERLTFLSSLQAGLRFNAQAPWAMGRTSMPCREPLSALASSWGQQAGLWTSALTQAGDVVLIPEPISRGWPPASMAGGKPPFAFALDSEQGAYWIVRTGRGTSLLHKPGVVSAARAREAALRGGAEERLFVFGKGRAFRSGELSMARVRVTAAGSVAVYGVDFREVP